MLSGVFSLKFCLGFSPVFNETIISFIYFHSTILLYLVNVKYARHNPAMAIIVPIVHFKNPQNIELHLSSYSKIMASIFALFTFS